MKNVVLVGAGGKMGMRTTANLKGNANYEVFYLEVSEVGIARLQEKGVHVSQPEDVLPEADIVILAVPDVAIKSVASSIVPQMKSGAMAVTLDPAAPCAGHLPEREDVTYFAAHPSHPSVFNWEPNEEAHYDYFGGIAAKQTIVCALIQGPEEDYAVGEALAKEMYKPVTKSHRVTIEQMGILEPALSETFGAAVVTVMKEAVDTVVAKGVPKEAAYDFFLGHINIELALLFDQLPGGVFSDAAQKAIIYGIPRIFKDDWKDVFEWENVMDQIKAIT
ncbi:phosphogluconate dehydrogenase C-terminal domain-containing protein [Tunicatimonas pelagia]|uniref:phosphogluconate dehydrogenase C-terminal domain-containing protein n=1 Tax=Tunicatimonas pelagia TaxID=931531 RepID=UPI00266717EB|nr:phosphogluconate dehydrogenase C-terminal domain-containing protein [Tunicatimonas pelagia]WKN46176.1 phosphogluconate dehydrogenase C-terminal domain-containing protein [Tunicatimonas pelagia]